MLSHPKIQTPEPGPRRGGSVSIWAIACLMFVMVLSATLGRMALTGSRLMIQERRHSQADWLAHSGWLLATAQLQRNPDYKGEIWNIPPSELGGADGGRVRIDVELPAAGAPPEARDLSIVAEFPVGSDRRVQITRRGSWRIPKP